MGKWFVIELKGVQWPPDIFPVFWPPSRGRRSAGRGIGRVGCDSFFCAFAPPAYLWDLWSQNGPTRTGLNIRAPRPTNNTGDKISVLYNALMWVRDTDGTSSTLIRQLILLFTDSEYCVLFFGDKSIEARCNELERVGLPLHGVCAYHDIGLFWIKAHTCLLYTSPSPRD